MVKELAQPALFSTEKAYRHDSTDLPFILLERLGSLPPLLLFAFR